MDVTPVGSTVVAGWGVDRPTPMGGHGLYGPMPTNEHLLALSSLAFGTPPQQQTAPPGPGGATQGWPAAMEIDGPPVGGGGERGDGRCDNDGSGGNVGGGGGGDDGGGGCGGGGASVSGSVLFNSTPVPAVKDHDGASSGRGSSAASNLRGESRGSGSGCSDLIGGGVIPGTGRGNGGSGAMVVAVKLLYA